MTPTKLRILLSKTDPIAAAPSTADKAEVAQVLIDRAAEAARARYVTNTPSQSGVYDLKSAEADALHAAIGAGGEPNAADYPHLSSEIGITANDLVAVGDVIRAKRAAWITASATIEGLRLGAKDAVANATDESEIRAALSITWPQPD